MIERIKQDIRYAARLLARRPAFSATAILTLTLGMGGTTAVFSLLDALLLRTLPVDRPEELVRLVERRPDGTSADAFTLVTEDMLKASRTVAGVAASARPFGRTEEIELGGEKRNAFVQLVSNNYFELLGVKPLRGRLFHAAEPVSADPIAIISQDYWRRQYQSDPAALGTRIRRGTREFVIAGVASAGFRGTEVDVPIDVWLSIDQTVPPDSIERTRGRWMRIMARLQPGATATAAAAEMSTLLGRPVQLQAGGIGYSALRLRLYQPLVLVALVVGLVLLIACANLANLMMAATVSRGRELAVRAAIGATRGRLVRQLLTESLLLSLIGVALGLIVARWTSGLLLAFLPPDQAVALPNLRFELDRSVLTFAAFLTCATCLLFGLAPALRLSGRVTAADLRAGSGTGQRTRSWMTRGLLVSQVVMCTALLIVAGVFLRTLQNLRGQDTGYREAHLTVADVGFPRDYPEARRDALIEELVARAAALPAVQHAAFSHLGQLSGGGIEWRIAFPGRSTPEAEQPLVMGSSTRWARRWRSAATSRPPITSAPRW
jgi:putative ABC transport system permease protein